ncbi:unnamed protein product [Lathyrus sativus]|nr:unnamed protein product [Lathyrus sativus]
MFEFNLALLQKWKWRILTENDGTWLDILRARYGNICNAILGGNRSSKSCKGYHWWKDLIDSGWSAWFQPLFL